MRQVSPNKGGLLQDKGEKKEHGDEHKDKTSDDQLVSTTTAMMVSVQQMLAYLYYLVQQNVIIFSENMLHYCFCWEAIGGESQSVCDSLPRM